MGRAAAIAAVLAAAALLPAAAAAAPTRAQFIRQGDALCAAVQRDLAPIRTQAKSAASLPEAQKWVAVTKLWTAQVEIQKAFNARFHSIGVPAGDVEARTLVAKLDRGLVLARQVRDGFAARSRSTLERALPAYLTFTLALNSRVAAYGFKTCGRG